VKVILFTVRARFPLILSHIPDSSSLPEVYHFENVVSQKVIC